MGFPALTEEQTLLSDFIKRQNGVSVIFAQNLLTLQSCLEQRIAKTALKLHIIRNKT